MDGELRNTEREVPTTQSRDAARVRSLAARRKIRVRDRLSYVWQSLRSDPTAGLRPVELDEMAEFYCRAFAERSVDTFREGLAKTDAVWRIRGKDRALAGFGTLNIVEVELDGRMHRGLFTGWVGLSPHVRGLSLTQLIGFRNFITQRLRHPRDHLYWIFTSSTYLSYLVLPNNFRDYYPRIDAPNPAHIDALMRRLGVQLGLRECEGRWVLERQGEVRYKEGVFAREPEALENPHVRVYAELNPGQSKGDSLLCVVPLKVGNWVHCLRQGLKRVLRAVKG